MLRQLLADRFGLRAHYEQRPRRVLALTVARRQPAALQRLDVDCESIGPQTADLPSSPTSPMKPCTWLNSNALINSGGMTMKRLAQMLTTLMEEPVVDQTDLPGDYRFVLSFTRPGPGMPEPSDDYPVIPTALQEQLGLKLARGRANLGVLVIDAVHRPTPD
jgi:uncharacterized protein (TIGR03435 family)